MPIFRHTIRPRSRRERARHVDRAFEIFFKTFLVCYLLFIWATLLSHRDTWRITNIEIKGVQAVDPVAIERAVEVELSRKVLWKIDRNNAVLYPGRDMARAIMTIDTRVKGVVTDVKGKQITIHVSEYIPALLWCPPERQPDDILARTDQGSVRAGPPERQPDNIPVVAGGSAEEGLPDGALSMTTSVTEGCSFADERGYIFAPAPGYSGNPFLVFMTTIYRENNGAVLAEEEFKKLNIFLGKLEQLGLSPRRIRESGAHDFIITTDQPWEVRWLSTRDPDADIENLSIVLKNLSGEHMSTSTLKLVDLRFGNKVFYR